MQPDTTGPWTPVAFSKDLPNRTVMPAQITAGPIALWRNGSGQAAASVDRCPHRGMRLSHGFVRGEALSCIYHGWSYAQAGHCLRIPAHPGLVPPETIRVATYAVNERGGIIWIASGEPHGEPPLFEGLAPLRSLTANASIGAIEAATGKTADAEGLLEFSHDLGTAFLLLCAQGQDSTLIHVLLETSADAGAGIAASRAMERLRREAEKFQLEEVTP
ncbi:Rieske 2Fe-2S domain-containing protein [Rhizobium sp. GR12]|uniref:Rieske 2Fe-2S domain-containing protein n=1 Tax=Rhizobium sp. GR12 TaxID=3053925 RepID=UPI002FBECD18